MTIKLSDLFRLTEDKIKLATDLCARAFYDDPLIIYYFPDETERLIKSAYPFEFLIRYGVLYGEIYAISNKLEGLAAWWPPKFAIMTIERQIECGGVELISKLGRDFSKKARHVEEFISLAQERHAPFPHWYLSPIAIDPEFQGKGYASILLRSMLARIDRENVPVYLYTNKERNASIYKHFNFKIVEETIIPKTDVPFWAMLRESH
ncbi:MAG: GNAT family N-acetyltransferase [Candidatus Hodarchaeota archaeon]